MNMVKAYQIFDVHYKRKNSERVLCIRLNKNLISLLANNIFFQF